MLKQKFIMWNRFFEMKFPSVICFSCVRLYEIAIMLSLNCVPSLHLVRFSLFLPSSDFTLVVQPQEVCFPCPLLLLLKFASFCFTVLAAEG